MFLYLKKNVKCVLDVKILFFSIIEITKSPNFFMNFKGNKFMVSNIHDNKEISSGIGERDYMF